MDLEVFAGFLSVVGAWVNFINVIRFAVRRKRRNRRWWVRPILRTRSLYGAYDTLFQTLKLTDHEEFVGYTRMTVPHFDKLHNLIEPLLIKLSFRTPLPSELRLAATLSYLAHGDSIRSKAWQFRIGRSTMFKIVAETCRAIVSVLQPLYLRTPVAEEWLSISQGFNSRWNFPNCIGAVDGKHIRIKAPPNSGTLYHNYKGFFSLVLLAAVDSKYRFLWVDVGDYGSHNDAGIFSSSTFGQSLEAGQMDLPPPQLLSGTNVATPLAFVGDEAFPLREYMMRPYSRRALTCDKQRIFNYRLSRARRIVENAFGILVSRWAILQGSISFKVNTAETIVYALTCLHNFLMTDEEDLNHPENFYVSPGLVDEEGPNGELVPGEWRMINHPGGVFNRLGRLGGNRGGLAASNQRDTLSEYFMSPEGSVPWQWRNI